MKITKLYAPWSPHFWTPLFKERYQLDDYNPKSSDDRRQPVVIFGMYGGGTKHDAMNHQGLCVIVWSGGDSVRLNEHSHFVDWCKLNEHRVFHLAHSHWIQEDLRHFGLKFIDRVVIPKKVDGFSFEKEPGEAVYHYGTSQRRFYYGTEVMEAIDKKWRKMGGYPEIIFTNQDHFRYQELYNAYKRSFIGVRLTEHDNMSMTAIEMGLMGRRTIFNGDVPCAIHYPVEPYHYTVETKRRWVWQDESLVDIVGRMILDYRGVEPDPLLAEEMREFVYDDLSWLNTEFYE